MKESDGAQTSKSNRPDYGPANPSMIKRSNSALPLRSAAAA